MLDTTAITTLAPSSPSGRRAQRDVLAGIKGLPVDDARESLRAAQDAIHHGAWGLPPVDAEPLMLAIRRTVEGATA